MVPDGRNRGHRRRRHPKDGRSCQFSARQHTLDYPRRLVWIYRKVHPSRCAQYHETRCQEFKRQTLAFRAVLFSSRAPIGYVAIASQPLTTNQGFKSFVLPQGIDSSYVYYYLLGRGNWLNNWLEALRSRRFRVPARQEPLLPSPPSPNSVASSPRSRSSLRGSTPPSPRWSAFGPT